MFVQIKHNDEDEEYLKENIVCGGDVKLCAVASPVALHVVDLHTVAIGALRDQNDYDHNYDAVEDNFDHNYDDVKDNFYHNYDDIKDNFTKDV